MSFLISSQRTNERDALSEAFYVISDVLNHNVKPLKARVPGLSILKLVDEMVDPYTILNDIRSYIAEKGPLVACLKIVPLEYLIKTDLPSIIIQTKKLAQRKILPSNSWRITLNKRQNNLRSAQIIKDVADEINWGIVKLKDADLEIRIEIIRDLTGLSVMSPRTEISMVKFSSA
ncbi:MAG: THUMP domain-containing protein [Promethearchaeota archaeon]|jgi:tRNA(Ser,Leu) C12 N-acetylase TAN1